ncbi:protein tyrosine phosphatase-like protein, PTPLA domain-containing protein [Ditylenchus destructor]|uniref:Very-long-chain (3R)-3-hydroxyacyl-CoA dehydratase n=1 Tax=Ditylenchus destructor TaxID=166010 RepID=A0AAD4N7Q6_9BILA|nr:protein tyrosine phosphatase-like protein, PTPLA domain-containing protein [Ditylenchus destructor]
MTTLLSGRDFSQESTNIIQEKSRSVSNAAITARVQELDSNRDSDDSNLERKHPVLHDVIIDNGGPYPIMGSMPCGPIRAEPAQNIAMRPSDLYLIFYNALQVLGWGSILVKTVSGLLHGATNEQLYTNVELELQIFQTAAILESRASIGVPMLLVAWSITEVVRYSFYALNLLKAVPHVLTWMRYTFFIALYPLGASGEVITMISALPEIGERKHFTLEMPNALNFGFSFYCFVIFLCLIYIPGFPQLYGYMFVQRKKVLATEETKKSA